MPKKQKEPKLHPKVSNPADNEKVFLPADIMQLISAIVKDIGKVKDVLDDVQNSDYAKAVQDLLAVIESIVVDMILPRVKAEKPEGDSEPEQPEQPADPKLPEDPQ